MPYLVPIVERPLPAGGLRQFWIFLERNGGHFLEVDSLDAVTPFLEENELSCGPRGVVQHPDHPELIFVDIDNTDKDLAQFYTWREVVPGTIPAREVWRPFLWVAEEAGWGVNRLLEEIALGPGAGHTAYQVLQAYLSLAASPP